MVDYKHGKLQRADRKTVYRDEKQALRDTKELIRQTKRDMFPSAKMTLRQIVERDKQIDEQLNALESLRGTAMEGHSKYAELKQAKRELKAQKKLLKLEAKSRLENLKTGGSMSDDDFDVGNENEYSDIGS